MKNSDITKVDNNNQKFGNRLDHELLALEERPALLHAWIGIFGSQEESTQQRM